MPPLFRPRYHYNDSTFTPPAPGKDLIMAVGLVFSRLGVGPKTGGRYAGIPLFVGLATTLFRRPDGIEMRLPNEDLVLWDAPFDAAARRHGITNLADRDGWEWLRWNLSEHVTAEYARPESVHGVAAVFAPADVNAEPLVIVPCGASKRDRTTARDRYAARDLYTGSYQRLCLRAAHALTAEPNIRILSGLHGLLALDDLVEPYEMRMGAPGSITVDDIAEQANVSGLVHAPDVVVLAGKNYSRMVTSIWPDARLPFTGSRGIGDQQHRLARIIAGGHPALNSLSPTT